MPVTTRRRKKTIAKVFPRPNPPDSPSSPGSEERERKWFEETYQHHRLPSSFLLFWLVGYFLGLTTADEFLQALQHEHDSATHKHNCDIY